MKVCEFCRMRGRIKEANYVVKIDDLEWNLCYDCDLDEWIKAESKGIKKPKNLKTLKCPYFLDRLDEFIEKYENKTYEQSSK